MKQQTQTVGQFINRLINKVRDFLNRLTEPDVELWLIIVLLLAGLTAIWCGGYSISVFTFITPLTSSVFLTIEALAIIGCLMLILYKQPEGETSPFNIIMEIADAVIVFIIAALICSAHLWWPKTAAGIGAAINLVLITTFVQEWLKEKRRLPTQQQA